MGEGKGEGYPQLEAYCFPLSSDSSHIIFHKVPVITYLNVSGSGGVLAHHIPFFFFLKVFFSQVYFVRGQKAAKVLYKQNKSTPPKY